jgi:rfaE bifunctional protein kinase chain/domain
MELQDRLGGILEHFRGQRILVAGDVILDRYWWGSASRLSPEAPVPVVRLDSSTVRPGGAANTAANLAALGAAPELFGAIAADAAGDEVRAALAASAVPAGWLSIEKDRQTITKTRAMAMNQHVVRVDDESASPVSSSVAAQAAAGIASRLAGASALVFSDYAKGFLTPALLQSCIAAANQAGAPVFVDPKGADYTRYAGCALLKPNRHELGMLTGMPVQTQTETAAAGCKLSEMMPGANILVTEGAAGMTLFSGGALRQRVASAPRQIYDVTGAGDTVLAVMALALAAGAEYREAMQLASAAASIAIGLMGTATVTAGQLNALLGDRNWLATNSV